MSMCIAQQRSIEAASSEELGDDVLKEIKDIARKVLGAQVLFPFSA